MPMNLSASLAAMLYGELSARQREILLTLDEEQLDDVMRNLRILHEGHKDLQKQLDRLGEE